MINFNEEYFSNNCYFFLKEREDKISLYYSVADTLTESRKKDDKKDEKKKSFKGKHESIFHNRKSHYRNFCVLLDG